MVTVINASEDAGSCRWPESVVGDTNWWRSACFYHIYPLSFADSNGDGRGDLPGITQHLPYLADLGVDAIWLSPFYASPLVDFGYDISNHCSVDPIFGTFDDFDHLVAAAHDLRLKVIVDFVANHTSDEHPWFRESRRSRFNARRDWYIWADPARDGGPPNNWLSCFAAVGSAWTFDIDSEQYYLHSYTPQQPDLNWWNADVRIAMEGVLHFGSNEE